MPDVRAIIKSIRRGSDKDSKAYKVTEYYLDLTSGSLDEGGIAIASAKILNIEKELLNWTKKHQNTWPVTILNEGKIIPPEEGSLILIDDLRKRGILHG
jgi:hypothetical protein